MFKRLIASLVCLTFSFSNLQYVHAQDFSINQLPVPGSMIGTTPAFVPLTLKGMVIHPENALKFDFLMDTGHSNLKGNDLSDEALKIMKYFLTALTIPEDDLWVNLSPYEKGRIVQNNFGQTIMGRDLLAEDYVLKQLTASVIYPENTLGKQFWSEIYSKASQQLGTTQIPVNTFNKVWIVPDQAVVWEHEGKVIIVKSHLKVMLEADYLSASKHQIPGLNNSKQISAADAMARDTVRKLVIPVLEKEVNTGKNFAQLRQMFQAMILATWYKKALRESILTKVYADQKKTKGVDGINAGDVESIYQQYLKAFKKGAFNYIKEDLDSTTGQSVPRKYFSGGFSLRNGLVTLATALLVWGATLTNVQAMDVNHALESTGTTVLVKGNITDVGPGASADMVKQFEQTPQSQQAQDAAMIGLTWILLRYNEQQLEDKLREYLAKQNYKTLIKLLNHDNWDVRAKTVEALGNLGDKRAIEPLLSALDQFAWFRSLVEQALIKLGVSNDQIVTSYIMVLSSDISPENMDPLIRRVLEFRNKRMIEPLLKKLSYKYEDKRKNVEEALKALGASNDQLVTGYLQAVLSRDMGVRVNAINKLGKLGNKRAIQPLLALFHESLSDLSRVVNSNLRANIVEALKELGISHVQIVQEYTRILTILEDKTNYPLYNAVSDELHTLFPTEGQHIYVNHGTPAKGHDVESEEWDNSYIGAGGGGKFIHRQWVEDEPAHPDWRKELRSDAAMLGLKLAIFTNTVEKYLAKQNYETLIKIMPYEEDKIVAQIAKALGNLGDKRAIKYLLEYGYLGWGNEEVRSSVDEALTKLGASREQLVDAYIKALSNLRNQINIIKRLGDLGDKRAIKRLVGYLRNDDYPADDKKIRLIAEETLTKLGTSNEQMVNGYLEVVSLAAMGYFRGFSIAVKKLGDLRDKRAIEPLLGMLWHDKEVEETLIKLGVSKDQLVDGYTRAVIPNNFGNRTDLKSYVIERLGTLADKGDKRVINRLLVYLSDEDSNVRSRARIALKELNASPEQIFQVNVKLLSSADFRAREEAAEALVASGGYEHEDLLKKLSGKTIMLLQEAIQLKQEGINFKPIYKAEEGYWDSSPSTWEHGADTETWITVSPEVLYLERINKAMLNPPTHQDKAALTKAPDHLGGIALDAAMLDLQIKRDGNGVPLPISQQPLDKINIQGFVPQIISIQPVDLPALLGFNFQKEEALAKA